MPRTKGYLFTLAAVLTGIVSSCAATLPSDDAASNAHPIGGGDASLREPINHTHFEETPCINGAFPGDSRPGYPYAVQEVGRRSPSGMMVRGGDLGCEPF